MEGCGWFLLALALSGAVVWCVQAAFDLTHFQTFAVVLVLGLICGNKSDS